MFIESVNKYKKNRSTKSGCYILVAFALQVAPVAVRIGFLMKFFSECICCFYVGIERFCYLIEGTELSSPHAPHNDSRDHEKNSYT